LGTGFSEEADERSIFEHVSVVDDECVSERVNDFEWEDGGAQSELKNFESLLLELSESPTPSSSGIASSMQSSNVNRPAPPVGAALHAVHREQPPEEMHRIAKSHFAERSNS
jgi:hypothetical protein